MSRVFDVIKWSAIAAGLRPAGVILEWPETVIEAEDTDAATPNAVRMTEAQYAAHTAQYRAAWGVYQRANATALDIYGKRKAAATALSADDHRLDRALVAAPVDEVNAVRQWIMSFKAAVAASTSLANLQTRVAALPNLPDRTAAQARTAILNKLAAGDADS